MAESAREIHAFTLEVGKGKRGTDFRAQVVPANFEVAPDPIGLAEAESLPKGASAGSALSKADESEPQSVPAPPSEEADESATPVVGTSPATIPPPPPSSAR